MISVELNFVASVLAAAGDGEIAATILGCVVKTVEELGIEAPYFEKRRDRTLAALREQLAEDTFARAWERGRHLSVDAAIELALQHGGLAQ